MGKDREYEDINKKLDEPEEEYPDTWNPEVGDKLIGKVTGIREPMTSVGQRKVAEITTEDGKTYSVWMRRVIEEEFKRKNIDVGTKIGIKYLGIPEGKRYHNYKIVRL